MIRTTLNLVKNFRPYRNRTGAAFLFGSSLLFGSVGLPLPAQELQAPATVEGEEEMAEVGLFGIYGKATNPDLDTEFFAGKMPENWKEWATGLDDEMLMYGYPEELDVKAQRELIQKLRLRLSTMQQAIDDPRFAPIHEPLISLAGPLDRHLKLSTAILDTLDEGVVPPSKETRQQSFDYLRESTGKLNTFLTHHPGGEEWKKTFGIDELSDKLADPNTPVENLQKHLDEALTRFDKREDYTADQLRLLRSNVFWQFHRAASQAQALLEWENKTPNKKTLRDTLQELGSSVVASERHNLVKNVQTMQRAWDKLVLINPKSKDRFDFLNTWFYSPNLYTQSAESVFNEVVDPPKTESEPINEVTDTGATVTGNSVTTTTQRIDLVPSPHEALMAVKVQGDIRTHAMAEKCSIKVYTHGSAQFWAEKPARFNGFHFHPDSAKIAVNATNIPYAAETPFSCLPVLGPCFDQMVLDQANAQRPQTEADMRQRIVDRAVPELNQEVNTTLADANDDLQNNRYRRLSKYNLYPSLMHTATTEEHMLSNTLIRDMVELGGGTPPLRFNHPTGVNYHIHESLLNNIADRMDVAGRTMTEEEFRAEVERFLTDLTGYTVDLSKPEEPQTEPSDDEKPKGKDKFVFDKVSPLKFQIRNNEIQVTVRTGLIRPDGETYDPHDIMIPIQYKLEGEVIKILIDKEHLRVNGVDGGSRLQIVGINNAIRKVISNSERSRYMTIEMQSGRTLELRTEEIKALDGWLSIWSVPVKTAPVGHAPLAPAQ